MLEGKHEAQTLEALIHSVIPPHARRLEPQGELARGGMATIEVAVDRALQRRVAIKLLHPDQRESMLAVRSFLREAQITGQLDHPNIVPVHELSVDERGRLYFTMKLVEGRTLHDLLDARRATHERSDLSGRKIASALDHEDLLQLLDAFNKVLDATAFAHSRGVVHLDLKPDNVLVGDYGQVYLMDWGIAKVMSKPAGGDPLGPSRWVEDPLPLPLREDVIMGTPAYMSPEQARGDHRAIDTRTDVFALGAMLFEILTGHPPYYGRNAIEVLLQAEEAEAALPADVPIARELRRIVARAMTKDVGARYESVEALQLDLRRFMRGGGNFPRQRFAAGEWIIREDEVGDAAYILVAGQCEVFKLIDGRWESLRTLGPGDVFGETAILASTPRTASVVALTEVHTMVVTREVLEREVEGMKPWMGAFIRALARRFSEAEEKRQLAAAALADRPPAPEIANFAMMVLDSWGRWDRDLGATMSLRRLCGAIKTNFAMTQDAVLAALDDYPQFTIDRERDVIGLRDKRALREALTGQLRW
ncbi:protein kinase [Pseudenhygromyxa sp. WMMC2535]|uniref:protein kinase domain-containing protein n=1 Tax=Pseudenhygromyxa sp. WMMC2535 TaxID=2712867 RepID=UPI001555D5CD|nr:protein kinase [Pseudenhygromyxa sp. WMMC2535]NVB40733.1 protein kinase [Pseudenhygromyxa sp. WMMC2535]